MASWVRQKATSSPILAEELQNRAVLCRLQRLHESPPFNGRLAMVTGQQEQEGCRITRLGGLIMRRDDLKLTGLSFSHLQQYHLCGLRADDAFAIRELLQQFVEQGHKVKATPNEDHDANHRHYQFLWEHTTIMVSVPDALSPYGSRLPGPSALDW